MASAFEPPRAPKSVTSKFFDETTTIPAEFRELLEKYSHIAPEEVEQRVVQLRNKAWGIHPYPCLGQFRFLELNLSKRKDLYSRLLSILKNGGRFLDVGCCLGQDIRKLVFDGAPAAAVAAAELDQRFINLGYELFQDEGNADTRIVAADILEPARESSLEAFVGRLDVVQLGMILHLFTWEEQAVAFENAVKLLKNEKGVLIIGMATGNLDGTVSGGALEEKTFKHNIETFNGLVREVGDKTGTRWSVKAELDTGLSIYDGKRTWDSPKTRRLLFEVERI